MTIPDIYPDRRVSPPVKDYPELVMPYPKDLTLSNGVKIRWLENGSQDVSRLTISYGRGLLDDLNPGAFTLMTGLLREGVEHMTGEEISELLDFNGAWLKTDPLCHNITVSLYSLNRSFNDLLPIIVGIICRPSFPEQQFEAFRERLAATHELNMKRVAYVAAMSDRKLTFGQNHPMARCQTPDEIRSISRADVVRSFNDAMRGKVPTIFFAGRVAKELPKLITAFESVDFDKADFESCNIIPMNPCGGGVYREVTDAEHQSAVCISIPTIGRGNADYIDLRLAVMALGGYFGSRLNQSIREEKGLTYGITANLLGYREGGVVSIQSQTDPRYVDELVSATADEIVRLGMIPMGQDELHAVKSYAMSALATMLDSPFTIMDHHIAYLHNFTSERYFEEQIEAIRNLTSEKISGVVQKYLAPDRMIVSIAGPK